MPDALIGEIDALETSPFGQCINSTVRVLAELDLGTVTDAEEPRIHVRKFPLINPTSDNIVTPAILVCPFPESFEDAFNTHVDVNYRVLVVLFRASNRGLIEGLGDELYWRNQIMHAFTRKQTQMTTDMVGSAMMLRVFPEPGEPLIPDNWRENYDAQWIVVNYVVRAGRLVT